MLPSKNLIAVSNFKAHQVPSQEFTLGLYSASAAQSARTPRTFATTQDALRAYHRGELTVADPVHILQHD